MNISKKLRFASLAISMVFALGFFGASCSSTSFHREKDRPGSRAVAKGLSVEHAKERASRVSDVQYDLEITLDRTSETYSGTVMIEFRLKDNEHPLTVDFEGGKVWTLNINDEELVQEAPHQHFITLPAKSLLVGSNRVYIGFEHPYSRTGSGLYRFQDPLDQNVYIYSDFEPYDANLLFPCFDQPSLKATYRLKVNAPQDWQVVTSTLETSKKVVGPKIRQWTFPESAVFSTYIFSLHAGPYRVWKSQADRVPLRLMARKSFAKYVDAQEWFKITQQGFKFFDQYFDYPYPFRKYDQIIVPDFNSGAMENVAAVTFSERYFPKGKPTQEVRERRANTLLHELAHMWFGNLVTMEWWDDLWLNESFATYMAHLALVSATEFKNAWKTFFSNSKQWAYWEDQLVTTHPIVVDVPDTESAFVNFDGITYGKGASVLKQLAYFVGDVNFREGVRRYFKKHAYKNTVMTDFVGAVEEASGRDLKPWVNEWLKTAGVNTVKADFQCRDGKIETLSLRQTAPLEQPTLRTHKTAMGLFEFKNGRWVRTKSESTFYGGALTPVASFNGQACPALNYANVEDHDYVKVSFDESSLKSLMSGLSQIEDSFDRLLMWESLWGMVQDAELSLYRYVDLVFAHLPKEKDIHLASPAADKAREIVDYLPVDQRRALGQKLSDFFWDLLEKAPAGSDFQKLWFDTAVSIARSPKSLGQFSDLLKGKIKFKGLDVDQDRRWVIIRQLNAYGAPEAQAIREAELQKDPSNEGRKGALAAEVSVPNRETKQKWFNELLKLDSKLTVAESRIVMRNLFPAEQEALHLEFSERYYENILKLQAHKEAVFMRGFTSSLAPGLCTSESLEQMSDYLDDQESKLSPPVKKSLKVARQENDRCIRIRALAQETRSGT